MNPEEESAERTIEELRKENQFLREELKRSHAEIERLRKLLEEALRSLKRQAAPFSKCRPTRDPKRPGLKGGLYYKAIQETALREAVEFLMLSFEGIRAGDQTQFGGAWSRSRIRLSLD